MTVSILSTTSPPANNAAHGSSSTMHQPLETAEPIITDDTSDYGDFTLDEQEIIDKLLANLPPAGAVAVAADEPPLELTDIEDFTDEEPRGVRLPKTLGRELRSPPWKQQQQQSRVEARVTVTIEDQTSVNVDAANGNYCQSTICQANQCADVLTSA
jgi:hypothetical protein